VEVVGALVLLAIVLGIPGLIWYFIIRRIVRGRRARKDVMFLAARLTEAQAEDFEQNILPQASNIFEQRALLTRYLETIEER
jgi:hypothetical protein